MLNAISGGAACVLATWYAISLDAYEFLLDKYYNEHNDIEKFGNVIII